MILVAIGLIIKGGWAETWNTVVDEFVSYHPVKPETQKYLLSYFKYYQYLTYQEKSNFEKKVQRFVNTKNFVQRGKLNEVTYETKVLVAATAIQISFGLKSFRFRHFKRILLYPDSYYSKIRQQFHYGEVHPAGIVVLSVRRFLKDLLKDSDGINLGLHEFAHALYIENKMLSVENRFLNQIALDEFAEIGKEEMVRIKNGESELFRPYGANNLFEFFSVSVELFFEKSIELHDHSPKVYSSLTKILNQDPVLITTQRF